LAIKINVISMSGPGRCFGSEEKSYTTFILALQDVKDFSSLPDSAYACSSK